MSSAPETPPPYYREELWNRLSRFYDPLVKLLLLPFGGERKLRKKLIDFANPGNGEQVLDVCCGTGTLTSLLAQRVRASGSVIGVDLSAGMLHIAKEKVKLPAVTFLKANVEHLPLHSGAFDKAFLSWGWHEMPRAARRNALREIHRTLKPGGNLLVLEYNLPRSGWGRLAIQAFVKLVEDKRTYKMLREGSLLAEMEEASFVVARRELLCGGMVQLAQGGKL